MRIGVVGYGTGGKNFHVPFIEAAKGVELVGVVARAPQTIAKVKADLPGIAIYSLYHFIIEGSFYTRKCTDAWRSSIKLHQSSAVSSVKSSR